MRRPNILILYTDQQRWDALGANGNGDIKTPHLDRLAEESTEFTQFTVCPNCSPTRASLMTGLLPHNHGVLQVEHCVDDDQSVLRSQYAHWAQNLVDAGYRTGYFGKWHIQPTGHINC